MNDIKSFRSELFKSLSQRIQSKGFRLKSTISSYDQVTEFGTNTLCVFVDKYEGYFSIGLQCYYSSKAIEKLLEEHYGKHPKKPLVGGDLRLLWQEFVHSEWPYRYSEIVHEFDMPIEFLAAEIFMLLEACGEKFFLYCQDIQNLHNIINNHPIASVYLAINYKNRATMGLLVAYVAGFSQEVIIDLADRYEEEISKCNLPFLDEFRLFRQSWGYV